MKYTIIGHLVDGRGGCQSVCTVSEELGFDEVNSATTVAFHTGFGYQSVNGECPYHQL